MNLIDVYIQEVTRRLSKGNREDIARELRSAIEDRLPDDYSEEDVKAVLEKFGNPAKLASGYRGWPNYLIGPRYFDTYVTFLKRILPVIIVLSLISVMAEYSIGDIGKESIISVIMKIVGYSIGNFFEIGVQVFFWLTLVFAILERTDQGKNQYPFAADRKKWTSDDLIKLPKKTAISALSVLGDLLWMVVGIILYFCADRFIGVYESSGDGLTFVTSVFNQEVLLGYWPIIVLLIGLNIALSVYKLIKRQWTKAIALCNAGFQLLTSAVCIIMLFNPSILSEGFIAYMTDSFGMTAHQLTTSIAGGGLFFFLLLAIVVAFDSLRKVKWI